MNMWAHIDCSISWTRLNRLTILLLNETLSSFLLQIWFAKTNKSLQLLVGSKLYNPERRIISNFDLGCWKWIKNCYVFTLY